MNKSVITKHKGFLLCQNIFGRKRTCKSVTNQKYNKTGNTKMYNKFGNTKMYNKFA